MRFHSRFFRGAARAALFGTIAIFIASSSPTLAADNGPMQRTLIVSGEGRVFAKPDQAILSSGVVTRGKTAVQTMADNARTMNAVFATLKKLGIPDKWIQTSGYSVGPVYTTDKDGMQHLSGYEAANQVTITVSDMTKVGMSIDALAQAGSNSIGGINFTFANPKPLMAQARRMAVADAIERAKLLAQAAGVSLGPIMTIQDGGSWAPSPPRPMMAMRASAESTPIAAGEEMVNANVTITYSIQ